jgi:hypothetical protein
MFASQCVGVGEATGGVPKGIRSLGAECCQGGAGVAAGGICSSSRRHAAAFESRSDRAKRVRAVGVDADDFGPHAVHPNGLDSQAGTASCHARESAIGSHARRLDVIAPVSACSSAEQRRIAGGRIWEPKPIGGRKRRLLRLDRIDRIVRRIRGRPDARSGQLRPSFHHLGRRGWEEWRGRRSRDRPEKQSGSLVTGKASPSRVGPEGLPLIAGSAAEPSAGAADGSRAGARLQPAAGRADRARKPRTRRSHRAPGDRRAHQGLKAGALRQPGGSASNRSP